MTKITKEYLEENFEMHHTSCRVGYESRKGNGHAVPYKGRYGTGYIWISPRWDTSRYVWYTYYVTSR